MMKLRLLLIVLAVTFLLWVLAAAVLAEEEQPSEVPAPYAGLKNPFSWSDASAQEAGKGIYQLSCLGCHGADGSSIAGSNFSAAGYPLSMEERTDFFFWVLSEGRLDKGMPPYKTPLAAAERWQVLTYLWSLGAAEASPEVTPATTPAAEGDDGVLRLTAPEQAQSGQPLTLTAVLQDSEGKAIVNATVAFLIEADFFTNGLMEVGDAVTDDKGAAVFEYTPRQTGEVQIVARYEAIETSTTVSLTEAGEPFYQTEAGIRLPAPGDEVFIGLRLPLEPKGSAPIIGLRLPGGIFSWFLLLVAAVMVIWVTYLRVMYQLLRIPIVEEIREINTRLVPLIGMAAVVALGMLLVLMLITGPYSHPHLLQ